MSAGTWFGLVAVVGVITGYVVAMKRLSWPVFWMTLSASGLLLALVFSELGFVETLFGESGLDLAILAIFVWGPLFAIAPIVAFAVMSNRLAKQRTPQE